MFTIHAAGKRMTFLMDTNLLPIFVGSPNLDFQKAVQPFTQRAGDHFNVQHLDCVAGFEAFNLKNLFPYNYVLHSA